MVFPGRRAPGIYTQKTKTTRTMVMCAPNCECKWCKLAKMMEHPVFKPKLEGLIDNYSWYVNLTGPGPQVVMRGAGA